MELVDRLLVDRFVPENQELRELVQAHQQYEDDITALSERPWLSQTDQQQLRMLKKQKLRGRDRIEQILRGYRSQVAHT
ncbi:MAG: YdcH family protein [Myxococcota bacterium]